MENPNFDETLPTQIRRESDSASSADQFKETVPIPINQGVEDGHTRSQEPAPVSPGQTPSRAASYEAPASTSGQKPRPAGKRLSLPILSVLGLIGLVLIAMASALSGYRSGIELRKGAASTQVAMSVQEQFALGEQDIAEGNYDRARQRFEYIIQINPNYPGVTDRLADVLLHINTTATPTVAPTPTVTPTPDMRSVEELYNQAQQSLINSDWTSTIDTLLELRKDDPNFHPVEVDGMLFLALRNRGVDKILQQADLEGGTYDLALAERFGPVDTEAQGIENWARLYITGASFWEIDWKQAVDYFSQVGPAMPGLRDGSGMSSTERYRQALIGYGNSLASQEQWCDAQAQYELALSFGPDAEAEEALGEVSQNCAGISDEESPEEENPATEEVTPPAEETPPVDGLPTPEVTPPPEEPTPYPEPSA